MEKYPGYTAPNIIVGVTDMVSGPSLLLLTLVLVISGTILVSERPIVAVAVFIHYGLWHTF